MVDDAQWFRAPLHASCFASRMRSIYAWCCIVTPTRQQPRRRFLWCSGGCERLLALPCVHWCTRCPAGLCATAAPGAVLALAAQRSCIVPTPLPQLPDATVTVSMQYTVAVSPQLSSPRVACIPRASLDFHVMDAKTSAVKIAETVEVALPAAWQSQLMPDAEVRAVCTNKLWSPVCSLLRRGVVFAAAGPALLAPRHRRCPAGGSASLHTARYACACAIHC